MLIRPNVVFDQNDGVETNLWQLKWWLVAGWHTNDHSMGLLMCSRHLATDIWCASKLFIEKKNSNNTNFSTFAIPLIVCEFLIIYLFAIAPLVASLLFAFVL